MNDEIKTKQIVEGLLLTAGKPLSLGQIANIFLDHERPDTEALKKIMEEIEQDCEARGFELKKVASGYRFQVRQEYSEWIGRLWDEKPQRYSRALLETLAIIAYRQPITRGEIEKIRGVAVSTSIIRTLMEREWVRVVGHRDVPGKPAMYATSKQFLDYFDLKNLNELPTLAEIKDMEELNPELALEVETPESRVLEFPSAEELEEEIEVLDEEEEAAAAIGTRPLNEILGIEEPEDDQEESEVDSEVDSEANINGDSLEVEEEDVRGSEEFSESEEENDPDKTDAIGGDR